MKDFVISLVILILIVVSTCIVAVSINTMLKSFISTVQEEVIEEDGVFRGVDTIEAEYKKIKPFLVFFTCAKDLREIESQLADIKSAAESKDSAAFICAKNRIALHCEHLRRISTFTTEAIF